MPWKYPRMTRRRTRDTPVQEEEKDIRSGGSIFEPPYFLFLDIVDSGILAEKGKDILDKGKCKKSTVHKGNGVDDG